MNDKNNCVHLHHHIHSSPAAHKRTRSHSFEDIRRHRIRSIQRGLGVVFAQNV